MVAVLVVLGYAGTLLLGALAPTAVRAEEPPQLTERITDLAGVLDLTAPRAYYLCTWLPAILSNSR